MKNKKQKKVGIDFWYTLSGVLFIIGLISMFIGFFGFGGDLSVFEEHFGWFGARALYSAIISVTAFLLLKLIFFLFVKEKDNNIVADGFDQSVNRFNAE